jgi:hypothetical protein
MLENWLLKGIFQPKSEEVTGSVGDCITSLKVFALHKVLSWLIQSSRKRWTSTCSTREIAVKCQHVSSLNP